MDQAVEAIAGAARREPCPRRGARRLGCRGGREHRSLSKGEKKKVKKIAKKQGRKQGKKQANKQIAKKAPSLSVAEAANSTALDGKSADEFASSASEPFREVGSASQPTFTNGWVNVGPPLSTAAFYKDPLVVVHLKGTISTGASPTSAFTLPAGYRPSQARFYASTEPAAPASVSVQQNGEVLVTCSSGASCALTLDGVSFRP